MKKLSKQRAEYYYRQLQNAKYYFITDLYKKPSLYKQRAEDKIIEQITAYNRAHEDSTAHRYRVIGGNSMTFVAGYYIDFENGTRRIIIETHANTYYYDFK